VGKNREGDRRDGRLTADTGKRVFNRVSGGGLSDSGYRIAVPGYPAGLRTAF